MLLQGLEQRHPEGWETPLQDGFLALLRVRQRDVLPYVLRHVGNVSRGLIFRKLTLYVPMRFVRGSADKQGGYVLLRATKREALAWRHPPTGRRPPLRSGR